MKGSFRCIPLESAPRYDRGCDWGTSGFVVARGVYPDSPRLVWRPGHRAWQDRMIGHAYEPASLRIEGYPGQYGDVTHFIQEGSRLTRCSLDLAAPSTSIAFRIDAKLASEALRKFDTRHRTQTIVIVSGGVS